MPIPLDEHVRFSFEHHCRLNTPPGIRSDRTEVAAHVEVVKALTTHTFRAVPLLIIQNAERTRKFQVTSLDPESVTVVANGPRGTMARMHSREFSASISLDKVDKPGTYDLPISANVSTPGDSVKIKSIHPVTARVTVLQE